jgi:prevent-host-death family protein
MSIVQIHEAKAKLSSLIEAALSGEEIIIAKRNRPLVRLVPLNAEETTRKIGRAKGCIHMADDFDEIPEGFEEYLE